MVCNLSPPNLIVFPTYAENMAKVMATTSSQVFRHRSRQPTRNPFINDMVEKCNGEGSAYLFIDHNKCARYLNLCFNLYGS